ncbi:MAG TPA: hypothetical protein VID48_09680 [Solirubrobacteraceae bacterium]
MKPARWTDAHPGTLIGGADRFPSRLPSDLADSTGRAGVRARPDLCNSGD